MYEKGKKKDVTSTLRIGSCLINLRGTAGPGKLALKIQDFHWAKKGQYRVDTVVLQGGSLWTVHCSWESVKLTNVQEVYEFKNLKL